MDSDAGRLALSPSPHWLLRLLGLVLGLPVLGGCKASEFAVAIGAYQDVVGASVQPENTHVWMTVGERRFAITLADTEAARSFAAQLPLALEMAELNGNEKHADLGQALPVNASRPGTIHSGDLLLYGSNTVVVFYETFRSSYTYTRLGRVDDPHGLAQALGRGSVRVVFSQR